MFTGLIEGIGTITAATPGDNAVLLHIETPIDPGPLGASLAVDGVCLTVTGKDGATVTATCGHETLERTTLGGLTPGSRVNLERALRVGDRLGGHLVSGHVDVVGQLVGRKLTGEALDLQIAAASELLRYVVEKGSIAVDGISLTVNQVAEHDFALSLIPHTQGETTLAEKPLGAHLNLEADIIAKYVEKLLGGFHSSGPGLSRSVLERAGFL